MPEFDIRRWFDPDELEPCPACGEQTGLRPSGDSLICIRCGYLERDQARPSKPDERDDP
jgi:hypothetical protein